MWYFSAGGTEYILENDLIVFIPTYFLYIQFSTIM